MSRFVLTAQLQLQAPTNVGQVVRQIQSQLNNVQVNVQVQGTQQAQRQLNQVTNATNQASSAAERLGRTFGLSIKRFAAFAVATRAVSLFTNSLSKAVEEAISFERELIKISQVTGKSISQLRDLTDEIGRLSTGLGVSSTSLLNVSKILSQAGLNADETRIALDALAKSELAPTFDNIQDTAEGVVAIFNQFRQGAEALEQQLGSINAVAGRFAVEAGDLIGVVRRVGGVFQASGGDLNELLALFTSVRATTRESAESIATGLRTIFTRIQRPKTIEFLRQYGVELIDLEGKFVGPFEATRRLSEALAGLEQGDITFIRIAEELGGFRQIGKVIPLLQQFRVAQEALNVAQQGSGSLADDAAKAQAALAVRITKVKEQFLELVRSITETTAFQLFANTALSLAEAFIKLADALKPVLPLLAAVAGFRLATGLAGFVRGIGGGLRTPRGFAKGGLVPGSGNRDTVPAMLTPGEFVIRKSSVNKLGAGNLAAMNNNKYAAGGIVTSNRHGYGRYSPNSRAMTNAKNSVTPSIWKSMSDDKKQELAARMQNKNTFSQAKGLSKDRKKKLDKYPGGYYTTRPNSIGGFFLTPEKGVDSGYKLASDREFKINGQNAAIAAGSTISNFLPFRNDLAKNSRLNKIVDGNAKRGIKTGVVNSSLRIGQLLGGAIDINEDNITKAADRISNDKQVFSTLGGYIYEGIIQGITGARLSGGQTSFDYNKLTSQNKSGLATFFAASEASLAGLIKADAKRSLNSSSNLSIFDKLANSIASGDMRGVKKLGELKMQKKALGGIIKKFATGGAATGTDTVPALLTPGEFVINRQSAQKIGYGSLNRMNKVGKYANGGVVQHFARGGSAISKGVEAFGLTSMPDFQQWKLAEAEIKRLSGVIKVYTDKVNKTAANQTRLQVEETALLKEVTKLKLQSSKSADEQKKLSDLQTQLRNIQDKKSKELVKQLNAEAQLTQAIQNRTTAINKAQNFKQGVTNTITSAGAAQNFNGQAGITPSYNATEYQRQKSYSEAKAKNRERQSKNFGLGLSNRTSGDAGMTKAGNKTPMDITAAAFAISMVSSSLQSMLPPLDENASAFTKLSHKALEMITALAGVMFALQAFGISLKASSVSNFLGGKGLGFGGMKSVMSAGQGFGLAPSSARALTGVVNNLTKMIGPAIAVIGALKGIQLASDALISSLYGDAKAAKEAAIQKGDIEEAGKQARIESNRGVSNSAIFGTAAAGAVIGAALGTFVPVIGNAVGALGGAVIGAGVGAILGAVSLLSDPFGQFGDEAANTAMAIAANNKASKDLAQAQSDAARAAEEFKNGTISASEYLNTFSTSAKSIAETQKYSESVVKQSIEGKSEIGSGAILRNIGAYLGGGLFGMETAATRNKRLSQEGVSVVKQQRESEATLFQQSEAARNATIKSILAQGGTQEQARARVQEALGYNTEEMQRRASSLRFRAEEARQAGDTNLASELDLQATQLFNQAKDLNQAFENIAKEVERTRKAFDAMNLGFQNVTAVSGALTLGLNNYLASQEAGYSGLNNTIATLEASITSAAQGISDDAFGSALGDAAANLRKLGASNQQITKFTDNLTAINTAQKFFANVSKETKKRLEDEFKKGGNAGLSAEDQKKKFSDVITEELSRAGIGDKARERISAAIDGANIEEGDLNKILEGDLSVLDKVLKDLGETTLNQVIGPLQELAKYNQELANITKKRLDLENQVVNSQKALLDAQLEAQEIIAKYGGPAVTPEIRRQNILAQANVEGQAAGIGNLQAGTGAELNARNAQIRGQLSQISAIRQQAAQEGPAGDVARAQLEGESGVRLAEQEKRLQELAKSDYDTTKKLIQQKEDELKIIGEKNKAEKAAIESLLAGDIEKYFEQQAAVGATAALASGNQTLINAFGAKAVGAAALDIQRQQEAGVQTLYGQQLGGAGGLAERAFGSALAARGVSSTTMAQVAAGSTPEEEAAKSEIRELAATLPNYAQTQLEVAQSGLEVANIQYTAAQMQLEAAKANAKARGVDIAGMAKGGVVYANRGIFVPRGTDTVPAMLTPGEFVVRREAVRRGNNLQLLKAMNNGQGGVSNSGAAVGMARGGVVRYYDGGAKVDANNGGVGFGISPEIINKLAESLNDFNTKLQANIEKLNNTTVNVKLDPTNVNVTLVGTSFLGNLKDSIKSELLREIGEQLINDYKVVDGGRIKKDAGVK